MGCGQSKEKDQVTFTASPRPIKVDKVYEIEPRHAPGMRIEVSGVGKCTELQLSERQVSISQQFAVRRAESCFYALEALNCPGSAIDHGGDGCQQCNICEHFGFTELYQHFRLDGVPDANGSYHEGYYHVISRTNGMYWDCKDAGKENGTQLLTWANEEDEKLAHRQFKFIEVEGAVPPKLSSETREVAKAKSQLLAAFEKTDIMKYTNWGSDAPLSEWDLLVTNEGGDKVYDINREVVKSDYGFETITGEVDFTKLPDTITTISLQDCGLSGNVDLTKLPSNLEYLLLCRNKFSGSIDLTKLPNSVKTVSLSDNQFNGEIDLTQLPESLKSMDMERNKLTGFVDLTKLPPNLNDVRMLENDLTFAPEEERFNGGHKPEFIDLP